MSNTITTILNTQLDTCLAAVNGLTLKASEQAAVDIFTQWSTIPNFAREQAACAKFLEANPSSLSLAYSPFLLDGFAAHRASLKDAESKTFFINKMRNAIIRSLAKMATGLSIQAAIKPPKETPAQARVSTDKATDTPQAPLGQVEQANDMLSSIHKRFTAMAALCPSALYIDQIEAVNKAMLKAKLDAELVNYVLNALVIARCLTDNEYADVTLNLKQQAA
jgi:hypothetical protein